MGLCRCVNLEKMIPTVLDHNSFIPRKTGQSVVVYWRGAYYEAAIQGLHYSEKAAQDLRSVHNIDVLAELREVFEQEVWMYD